MDSHGKYTHHVHEWELNLSEARSVLGTDSSFGCQSVFLICLYMSMSHSQGKMKFCTKNIYLNHTKKNENNKIHRLRREERDGCVQRKKSRWEILSYFIHTNKKTDKNCFTAYQGFGIIINCAMVFYVGMYGCRYVDVWRILVVIVTFRFRRLGILTCYVNKTNHLQIFIALPLISSAIKVICKCLFENLI